MLDYQGPTVVQTCQIIKGPLYGPNMSDYQGSIVWSKHVRLSRVHCMVQTCQIIKGPLYGPNMSDYQGSIVWSKHVRLSRSHYIVQTCQIIKIIECIFASFSLSV